MAFRRRDGIWLALMAVVVIWGGQMFNYVDAATNDLYGTISEADDDRIQVETAVLRYYVEEIDPVKIQLAEIDGIINELDTFSDYLNEQEQEALRITLEGAFGGLGIEINTVDHYPTVIAPLEDTPAWEVGLMAGDQIVEIENEPTRDVHLNVIVGKLRGVPGTVVNIKVARRGVSTPIPFSITRARITVHSVRFSGFIWDPQSGDAVTADTPEWVRSGERIGYVRLANFHRGATTDVRNGLQQFAARDVRGIVLDLRQNPGGLLEEARGVADLFLPRGQLIVSARGRAAHSEQRLYSEIDPIVNINVPVAVLVDEASASASEIVAGAIQDNDRGLIIGANTYGKGSVQTVYNARFGPRYGLRFSSSAELKLTTAYYYSPSGRCIHRPRWRDGRRGAVVAKSESDTSNYETRMNRTVRGGGGIAPDVPVNTLINRSLYGLIPPRTLIHEYAFDYAARHPELTPTSFHVTDAIVQEFQTFLDDTSKGFTAVLAGQNKLEELEQIITRAEYGESVTAQLNALREAIDSQENQQFTRIRPFLEARLRTAIASRIWGRNASIRAGFDGDEALEVAITYLNDQTRYTHQLSQSPPVPETDEDETQ